MQSNNKLHLGPFSIAVALPAPAKSREKSDAQPRQENKCSSTFKRVRAHKSRQKTLRLDTPSKSSNLFAPPARAKRLQ